MRKYVYLFLLPILFLILLFTKGKGVFKEFYKYFFWSIILYFALNVIRLIFWPDSFLTR
ncbi:MAG: hypothetical protein ACI9QL_000350 [Candidatus Omnitrophota bacterium]|jgi:hypothetical protein